jgi:hypothetical protein
MNPKSPVIGIDLDNTVISYERVFSQCAGEFGVMGKGRRWSKQQVRDRLRRMDGGESKWQRLQAVVYGERISEATLYPGVCRFLRACSDRSVPVYIISHKTMYPGDRSVKRNLREEAVRFLIGKSLFVPEGCRFPKDRLRFAATRRMKIGFIKNLGITHFIDDLIEAFMEPGFPSGVERILFAPDGRDAPDGVTVAGSWKEIYDSFF